MRRLRDFDSAERAFTIKAYSWAMAFGLICALLGALLAQRAGRHPLGGAIPGFILGTVLAGWLAKRLAAAGGAVGSSLYMPSGSSTPGARQYSLADTLAVRGRFFDAAAELQRCVEAYPDDVEPKLRLARLYRDQLQQPEDAVEWFRRILASAELPPTTEQAVTRELIEVYTHRLRRPRAAAPWLARLADRYPDTASGVWAKRELAEIKREMREE